MMAELAYNSVPLANNRRTVTRVTGTSEIGAGQPAALIVQEGVNRRRMLETVHAAVRVLQEDLRSKAPASELPTSGSKTV